MEASVIALLHGSMPGVFQFHPLGCMNSKIAFALFPHLTLSKFSRLGVSIDLKGSLAFM
jgi:hypothetical protein